VAADPFLKEHLYAISKFVGEGRVQTRMDALYNILQRMIKHSVSIVTPDPYGDYTTDLLQATTETKCGYTYQRVIFPIVNDIQADKNILGKATGLNVQRLNTTVLALHSDKVIGFLNVNFITSANALIAQYKWYHKIVDKLKVLIGK